MILKDLAADLGVEYWGDGDCEITTVATLKNAGVGSISFLANPKYKNQLEECKASVVIIHLDLFEEIKKDNQCNYLLSTNPYLAYARVSQLLYSNKNSIENISSKAFIDSGVKLGNDCLVAAGAVIDKSCIIGDGVSIGSGSVIGEGVVIGSRSRIAANVTIYKECEVGEDCIIHSGAVIGADGFGFANDCQRGGGEWVKIEQVGRVVIGDNVEIGANTTIDRGAIEDTVIGNGVKLDNQIQVAHNVRIGQNTAIAGCTAIAGSSIIGANCTIAGMVGITGHLNICDNVHITSKSLITKSIDKPGAYSSSFAADRDKSWKKKIARINMLESLFKRVKELENKI